MPRFNISEAILTGARIGASQALQRNQAEARKKAAEELAKKQSAASQKSRDHSLSMALLNRAMAGGNPELVRTILGRVGASQQTVNTSVDFAKETRDKLALEQVQKQAARDAAARERIAARLARGRGLDIQEKGLKATIEAQDAAARERIATRLARARRAEEAATARGRTAAFRELSLIHI